MNQSVWATKNAIRPSIAQIQRTVKKVFFDNKGPVMQLPVPKGRTVTGAFYKNVVLKKLKAHFKRHHPKTGLEYLRLLHDNALAHKARIMAEKVNVFTHSPFFPVIISCFPNSNSHLSGKRIQVEKCSWVCCISVPHDCAY